MAWGGDHVGKKKLTLGVSADGRVDDQILSICAKFRGAPPPESAHVHAATTFSP
jgi:hypothetical protein